MTQKKITLSTRPFQPFFLAAEDLLRLASPYYLQIKKEVPENVPQDVWQLDKSLSIASFMTKYAGLEALVNCAHNDFEAREARDLPVDYFVALPDKQRKNMQKKAFRQWYLPTRVFLLAPLCCDPIVDPRDAFDVTSSEWKEFEELVKIRNSFSHATQGQRQLLITKAGPKRWWGSDEFPDNFWPLTKAPRDHRILNYETALDLNHTIDWVVNKLRTLMPTQLDDSYMTDEQAKESEA